MLILKMISQVDNRKAWTVEVDNEYGREKIFPQSAEGLQERLSQFGEYFTPLPMPCLEEGYDWKNSEAVTVLGFLTVRNGDRWTNYLINQTTVYVMNTSGETIDKFVV